MIPLSDELPTVRTPWMTYAILLAMFLVWIFVASYLSGGAQAAWSGTAFMVLLFVCVLAHEFGHIFTAKAFGVAIDLSVDVLLISPTTAADTVSGKWEYAIVKWDGPDRLYYNMPDKFELVFLSERPPGSGKLWHSDTRDMDFALRRLDLGT